MTLLTEQQETEYINEWQRKGNLKARNIVAESNIPFLYSIVRSLKIKDVDLEQELINEGMIILLGCLNKFDTSKGYRFITYAGSSARGRMLDYLFRTKPDVIERATKDPEFNLDWLNSKDNDQVSKLNNERVLTKVDEYLTTIKPAHKDCFISNFLNSNKGAALRNNLSEPTACRYSKYVISEVRRLFKVDYYGQ